MKNNEEKENIKTYECYLIKVIKKNNKNLV